MFSKNKTTSFLVFDRCVEEALQYYAKLIDDAEITSISRYKADEAGPEDTVMVATFKIKGQELICIDRAVKNEFAFTPATSIYVNCNSVMEIKRLFQEFAAEGKVFMDLTSYGFSELYGWVEDRYGISWQLNLD